MEYNIDYINLKYTLINCFLLNADKNVLDISYSANEKKIAIQIVLLEGFTFSMERVEDIKNKLFGFDVDITEIYLKKDMFNESKNEWQPQYYNWLDYLLFSKAEAL